MQRYVKPLATLARTLYTPDGPPTLDLLVEENVVQQVKNLVESDIIKGVSGVYIQLKRKNADISLQNWKKRGADGVVIHGWVYHLEDVRLSLLEDLISTDKHSL